MKSSLGFSIFRGVVIAAVVIVAAVGLYLGGAPAGERARRLDQQRISDLDSISNTVNTYYQSTGALPTSLDALLKNPSYSYLQTTSDPSTGAPYEYRTTGPMAYELCATFESELTATDQRVYSYPNPAFWKHGVGRTCYSFSTQNLQKFPTAAPPVPVTP